MKKKTRQCEAKTRKGQRCKNRVPITEEGYLCRVHKLSPPLDKFKAGFANARVSRAAIPIIASQPSRFDARATPRSAWAVLNSDVDMFLLNVKMT